jgi:fibrillarin-like rRNA methylase
MIDKFLKQDAAQKKQIFALKKTVDVFDKKVGDMLQKIEKC